MAVAHDGVSESHTSTTGSASEASFTWNHTPAGTPRGVLVFTFVNANADDALSVTYGGVALMRVTGGRALATSAEAGDCVAWFLGAGIPTGTQAVVVNRVNNADVMYAVAITSTAAANTEAVNPVLLQGSSIQAPAEQNVTDNSPGTNSVRYAGCNYGGLNIPAAGANSTALIGIDYGARTVGVVRETTAGQGSRAVGFSDGSDDVAAVHLAVRELTARAVEDDPPVAAGVGNGFASVALAGALLAGAMGALVSVVAAQGNNDDFVVPRPPIEEQYWQNPVPAVYWLPPQQAIIADDEIALLWLDEDFWHNPTDPIGAWMPPSQAITADDETPLLWLEEEYWHNPTDPIGAWLPPPQALVADDEIALLWLEEDYWTNPTAPVGMWLPPPQSISADDEIATTPAPANEEYWQNPVAPDQWAIAPRAAVEQWLADVQEAVPVPLAFSTPVVGLFLAPVSSALPLPWRWDAGDSPIAAGAVDEPAPALLIAQPITITLPPTWGFDQPELPQITVEESDGPTLATWPTTAPSQPQNAHDDLPALAHDEDALPPIVAPAAIGTPRLAPWSDDATDLPLLTVEESEASQLPPPQWGWPVPRAAQDDGDLPLLSVEETDAPALRSWAAPAQSVPFWADDELPQPTVVAEDDYFSPQPLPTSAVRPVATDDGSDLPIPTPAALVGDEGWTNPVAPIPGYATAQPPTDDCDLPIAPPTTARDEDHSFVPVVAPASWLPSAWAVAAWFGDEQELVRPRAVDEDGWTPLPTVQPYVLAIAPWAYEQPDLPPIAHDDEAAAVLGSPTPTPAPRLELWNYDQPEVPQLGIDDAGEWRQRTQTWETRAVVFTDDGDWPTAPQLVEREGWAPAVPAPRIQRVAAPWDGQDEIVTPPEPVVSDDEAWPPAGMRPMPTLTLPWHTLASWGDDDAGLMVPAVLLVRARQATLTTPGMLDAALTAAGMRPAHLLDAG